MIIRMLLSEKILPIIGGILGGVYGGMNTDLMFNTPIKEAIILTIILIAIGGLCTIVSILNKR